jgi:hypothetical protein
MSADIQKKLLDAAETAKGDAEGFDFTTLWRVIEEVFADGGVTQDDFQPILIFAEQLFDAYVVPYDIPYLGKRVESLVEESVLRPLIRVGLEKLFDAYFGE